MKFPIKSNAVVVTFAHENRFRNLFTTGLQVCIERDHFIKHKLWKVLKQTQSSFVLRLEYKLWFSLQTVYLHYLTNKIMHPLHFHFVASERIWMTKLSGQS